MKILIADDDRTIHVKFTKPLTKEGFEIFNAYNGSEAVEMAQAHLPDLVLLDLTMPEMDGRDVCKFLKNSPDTKDIKIIMLTAKDEQFDRLLGFELGADEFISKPCSAAYIIRIIQQLFRAEE